MSSRMLGTLEFQPIRYISSRRENTNGGQKTIYLSTGHTTVAVRGNTKTDDIDSRTKFDDIPSLGASTMYELNLIQCEHYSQSCYARSLHELIRQEEGIIDNILAKTDEGRLNLVDISLLFFPFYS